MMAYVRTHMFLSGDSFLKKDFSEQSYIWAQIVHEREGQESGGKYN